MGRIKGFNRRWAMYCRDREQTRLAQYRSPLAVKLRPAVIIVLVLHLLSIGCLLAVMVTEAKAAPGDQIPREAQQHQSALKRNAQMIWGLGAPVATFAADALQPRKAGVPGAAAPTQPEPVQLDMSALTGFSFAKAAGMTDAEATQLAVDAGDAAIEDQMIAPIVAMLAQFEADGKTLEDFQAALEDLVGVMDDAALREVLDRALTYSILRGAATQAA